MIIVITRPEFIDNEVDAIVNLFEGRHIDRLHLRKPQASESEMEMLIRNIPAQYYSRISIHDFYALAKQYGLGGIHLTGRSPVPPTDWKGIMSTSCHSIEELAEKKKDDRFAYLSLSPIFDSISKQGYQAAFTPGALADAHNAGIIDSRVLALGGVTFARMDEVLAMGFGGGMILGDAWRTV